MHLEGPISAPRTVRSLRLLLACTVALATMGAIVPHAGAVPSAPRGSSTVRGMPSGAPPAATWPEPSLPTPRGWPFPDAFSRTGGTDRLASGAAFWTDFLYDDRGATGGLAGYETGSQTAEYAPSRGTYTYPDGPAANNGADIFRAAVGLTGRATYWRVDWNTLLDRKVPIAQWALDTDGDASTGVAAWPAGAGVSSAGIDRALIVSSRGAWLVDPRSGTRTAVGSVGGSVTIDTRSRSFIVRVPRSGLPVRGTWRVRLAAGLANAAGTEFAAVPLSRGAAPGQPAVYNVTFRTHRQESVLMYPSGAPAVLFGPHRPSALFANFWMEYAQAQALSAHDVTPFYWSVNWDRLGRADTTPEPLVRGYTNRWYVSRLSLGQGVVENGKDPEGGDVEPNFLGRVQPYAVYVPSGYNPQRPAPLTWILHSLGQIHNQYGGIAPDQVKSECEDRGSICATTLGFGPDGWYIDEAEVDFWQVWRSLADRYNLDADHTVISGYSMGGWGTVWLASRYPDLFAKGMEIAGPSRCGFRVVGPINGPATTSNPHCAQDGDVFPLMKNLRWVPLIMVHGFADELVPVSGALQEMFKLDRMGYRYHSQWYPAEDHMAFSIQNGWSTAAAQIGRPRRPQNPGHVTYAWYPDLTDARYGIGPTGVYWLRDLRARSSAPGILARVEAVSQAKPDPVVTVHRRVSTTVPGSPTPAVVRELAWSLGPSGKARPEIVLTLANVAGLTVDTARAGLHRGTIIVVTDGATTLTLRSLSPGTAIREGSRTIAHANEDGRAVVPLGSGRMTLSVG